MVQEGDNQNSENPRKLGELNNCFSSSLGRHSTVENVGESFGRSEGMPLLKTALRKHLGLGILTFALSHFALSLFALLLFALSLNIGNFKERL